MQASATITTPGKLDQESLDTYQNKNNTTCYWNTSQEPQIKQMVYQDMKTMMMEATQKMKMSQYGQANISANTIQVFEVPPL